MTLVIPQDHAFSYFLYIQMPYCVQLEKHFSLVGVLFQEWLNHLCRLN